MGHLPRYLIEQELAQGKLLAISGQHFKGGQLDLVAAGRRDVAHGPIANRLSQFIKGEAAALIPD